MTTIEKMSERDVFLHYRKNERQKLSRLRAYVEKNIPVDSRSEFDSFLNGYVNNLVQRVRAEVAYLKKQKGV